jgi:hypothetical protein
LLLRTQILALTCLFLGACSSDPGEPRPAREFSDPGVVTAGNVQLHYALTLTGDLPPAIAGSYDIVQRPNLALLTITLAPAAGAGTERLTALELDAQAVTLMGERQALSLRRVNELGGPTYLDCNRATSRADHDRDPGAHRHWRTRDHCPLDPGVRSRVNFTASCRAVKNRSK